MKLLYRLAMMYGYTKGYIEGTFEGIRDGYRESSPAGKKHLQLLGSIFLVLLLWFICVLVFIIASF